jgi:hypothetical protein
MPEPDRAPGQEPTTGQEPATSTHDERRAFVRLASDLDATVRLAAPTREQGWPGQVRDISRGGLGLLTWHRFRPGTYLDVELREHSGELRRVVTARVVHATPVRVQGSRYWLLGCAFDEPLSDAEFETLR